jgi:hypothetical protein
MVDYIIKAGRPARPWCQHVRIETLGEDTPRAWHRIAVEASRFDDQSDWFA